MNVTQIEKLDSLIRTAKQLAIVMHVNPDGDAMGSALALSQYAQHHKVPTTVVSPSVIAKSLDWLPQREAIFTFDENSVDDKQRLASFDTVIFVDHSSNGRCGDIPNYITTTKNRLAFVDHHPSPDFDVEIAISETESAATCCIIYEILQQLNANITVPMASCLYTGIVTDTGNFRYGKGIAQVFRIASELMLLGIDKEEITQKIYYRNPEHRLRLLGVTLKDKMHRVGKNSAYISLTKQNIRNVGANYEDTEDFVNYPLTIEEVYVSAIFIEKDDHIKISFRSRGNFDVNLLARNHFNGGGHHNASGGKFFGTMQEAIELYSKNII